MKVIIKTLEGESYEVIAPAGGRTTMAQLEDAALEKITPVDATIGQCKFILGGRQYKPQTTCEELDIKEGSTLFFIWQEIRRPTLIADLIERTVPSHMSTEVDPNIISIKMKVTPRGGCRVDPQYKLGLDKIERRHRQSVFLIEADEVLTKEEILKLEKINDVALNSFFGIPEKKIAKHPRQIRGFLEKNYYGQDELVFFPYVRRLEPYTTYLFGITSDLPLEMGIHKELSNLHYSEAWILFTTGPVLVESKYIKPADISRNRGRKCVRSKLDNEDGEGDESQDSGDSDELKILKELSAGDWYLVSLVFFFLFWAYGTALFSTVLY